MPEEVATPEVDEATPTHDGTDPGETSEGPSLEQQVQELIAERDQANERYKESRRGADQLATRLSQYEQQLQQLQQMQMQTQTANQPQLDSMGMTPEESERYAQMDDITDGKAMRKLELEGARRLNDYRLAQAVAGTLWYTNQMTQQSERKQKVSSIPDDPDVNALALEYMQDSPLFQSQNQGDYVQRNGQWIHREALALAHRAMTRQPQQEANRRREDPFAGGKKKGGEAKFDARRHLSGEERDLVNRSNQSGGVETSYEDYFNNLSAEERRRRLTG